MPVRNLHRHSHTAHHRHARWPRLPSYSPALAAALIASACTVTPPQRPLATVPLAAINSVTLDQYRSAVAHGSIASRTWGWSPFEHLVMAAFVFPLSVKLGLSQEGYYSLSLEDESRCQAVDGLLSLANWRGQAGSMRSPWQDLIRKRKSRIGIADAVGKAVEDLKAKGIINEDK